MNKSEFSAIAGLGPHSAEIISVLDALSVAAKQISAICARGPLEGAMAAATGDANADGDAQKALDVRADEIITAQLRGAPVAFYASEEQECAVTLRSGQPLAVTSDPLDGSSNIDTNVSIGTIFSIFAAKSSADASFLRPGSEQLCAGFFVYGPQTSLIVTLGDGTALYILDPRSREFVLSQRRTQIAPTSREYAINASNHHHWETPVRNYIEDCLLGTAGPLAEKRNMRWVGSLVADAMRIFARGGVFMYPGDDRSGYEHGRLRLLYEAAPAAFLVEQAGGKAIDGHARILELAPSELHQRAPLIFGSRSEIDTIQAYFKS